MNISSQKGSILILSIFGIFIFAGFLAFIANTGFLIVNKIQMQNAVDSSAYSGAVVQARGLNVLSSLNQSLEEVAGTYRKLLFLWSLAVLADRGQPEGPAQKIWRLRFEKPLRMLCSPGSLQNISCTQSRIISRFNPSHHNTSCRAIFSASGQSIVLKEAKEAGLENVRPMAWENIDSNRFSSWAMNFDENGKMPGLSVELKPDTAKHLVGAGANSVSKGVLCDVPAQWGLKKDYQKTQYVLSSMTTPDTKALYFTSYFGSGDKYYAIAKSKPVSRSTRSLLLNASDWEAKLVPVNESLEDNKTFQRIIKSNEIKT
ncbi:MAG: pilus assembly protein TadG-related protein [Nitrospiria bacterium]